MKAETKVSMTEQIRREKAVLFSKPVPAKHRMSKRISDEVYEDVEAVFFARQAKQFSKKYGHPIHFEEDVKRLFTFICRITENTQREVLGKSRKAKIVFARKMFSFFAYYYFGMIQQHTADYLRKERSTIATHIPDFINELEIYAAVREQAVKVDKYLQSILKERKNEI